MAKARIIPPIKKIPNQKPAPKVGPAAKLQAGESTSVPEEMLTPIRELEAMLIQAKQTLGDADVQVWIAESKRHVARLAVQDAEKAWLDKCSSICKTLGADMDNQELAWNLNSEEGLLTRTR